jgi:F0F1-type ATP synthase delta subunit
MIISPSLVVRVLMTQLERGADVSIVANGLRGLLATYRIENQIFDIQKLLMRHIQDQTNSNQAEIIVARESDISDGVAQQIVAAHIKDENDRYSVTIMPNVVGGYVLKYQGTVYDNSVRQRIDSLSHILQA